MVKIKSPSALAFYEVHPSKVSVASFKAETALVTSYSLKANSSEHSASYSAKSLSWLAYSSWMVETKSLSKV